MGHYVPLASRRGGKISRLFEHQREKGRERGALAKRKKEGFCRLNKHRQLGALFIVFKGDLVRRDGTLDPKKAPSRRIFSDRVARWRLKRSPIKRTPADRECVFSSRTYKTRNGLPLS